VVVVDWLCPVVLDRVVSLDRVTEPNCAQAGPARATEIEIAANAAAAFWVMSIPLKNPSS
jgi:hypothetical protein